MKKVLVISYYFPPAGGSAVQRVLKFVKYLPKFGWQPVVLTAREKDYVLRDDSLVNQIPENVRIYRTSAPDLYKWYGRMGSTERNIPLDLSAIAAKEGNKNELINWFALYIRSFIFIPDARIGWLPFAIKEGLKILKEEEIKVIFATSPPFTTALAGGLLGIISGVPWISDYRDPWTQAYFYFKRPRISKWIEESLEKWLLNKANKVLSINEKILKGLGEKYDFWDKKKWYIIPNGYDPEDFKGIRPVKDDFFTLTYTGTLNSSMNPASVLKAVRELSIKHRNFSDKVRLNFIGRIGPDVVSMFEDKIIKDKIKLIPHLPHQECLRYTTGADLLILLIPDSAKNEIIVTGKLFEYLRSGNPILGIAEGSEAADIIRETRTGFVVPVRDVNKIKEILWRCFQQWQKGKKMLEKPVQWNQVEKYDRKKASEKLAQLLNEMKKIL